LLYKCKICVTPAPFSFTSLLIPAHDGRLRFNSAKGSLQSYSSGKGLKPCDKEIPLAL
jgi:hypothetical protein